ncbi:hypothetical protein HanPSC8_Chr09g0387861 [Helianthus annuus]|nr:hypothetical protein HanPSC8_Chr09g0387861 [Helianthus annuus]
MPDIKFRHRSSSFRSPPTSYTLPFDPFSTEFATFTSPFSTILATLTSPVFTASNSFFFSSSSSSFFRSASALAASRAPIRLFKHLSISGGLVFGIKFSATSAGVISTSPNNSLILSNKSCVWIHK